jgi:hypothetical protein
MCPGFGSEITQLIKMHFFFENVVPLYYIITYTDTRFMKRSYSLRRRALGLSWRLHRKKRPSS